MFAAWLFQLMRTAPLWPEAPATLQGIGRHGWGLRVLCGIFFWRVRFSLRSLLLLAAGLSAGIGSYLRYEEASWQLTWRWSPPEDLAVERVEIAPDGQRMAMLFRPRATAAEGRQLPTVLLFDRSGATPEVAYRPEDLDPELFFDTHNRLRVAGDGQLADADSGKPMMTWAANEVLLGLSEDGGTALTSPREGTLPNLPKPLCAAWDVNRGAKRFALPAGSYWLGGPRCTEHGTIALALCCAPEFIKYPMDPEPMNAAFPPFRPSTRIEAWDLETGAVVQNFDHADPVSTAVLSPDGRWLLTGGFGFAVLWDVPNRRPVRRIKTKGSLEAAALGLDGTRAVIRTDGRFATIWAFVRTGVHDKGSLLDLTTDQPVAEVNFFELPSYFDLDPYYLSDYEVISEGYCKPRTPAFTPDGVRLVAFNKEFVPVVFDARSGEELCLLLDPQLNKRICTNTPVVAAAAETVLLHDTRTVYRYERQRPEYWWRLFWLPEVWLVALCTAGLCASLLRDGRMKQP